MLDINFVIAQSLTHMLQLLIAWALGVQVMAGRMKVHDTRKIMHFCLLIAPLALASVLSYKQTQVTLALSAWAFLTSVAVLIEPIRSRVPALHAAFVAHDRPEDRPYTVLWLFLQLLLTYVTVFCCSLWLQGHVDNVPNTLMLLTGAVCFGDGLAEPIGVRYGKHKYRVPSLAKGRTYTRSLEGSAVVYACSLVTVIALRYVIPEESFVPTESFIPMLILFPIAVTAAEAFSPHTFDGPLMYLAGTAAIVASLAL